MVRHHSAGYPAMARLTVSRLADPLDHGEPAAAACNGSGLARAEGPSAWTGGKMGGLSSLHAEFCAVEGDVLHWPPDVFGFTCLFAKVSGTYTHYITAPDLLRDVAEQASVDGRRWRKGLTTSRKTVPSSIRRAWRNICDSAGGDLERLKEDEEFVRSVLFLLACSDEACAGVGILEERSPDSFEVEAELALSTKGNLCRHLPPDTVRVLPKLHTPNPGLNIRSLSHHLALCSVSEVVANWTQSPINARPRTGKLKILLAPWPLRVGPGAYCASSIKNNDRFGYFDYEPPTPSVMVLEWLKLKLGEAATLGHQVDLVVFPECALSEQEWAQVSAHCASEGVGVLSGVHALGTRGKRNRNLVKMRLPLALSEITQAKHHRWQIEAGQIRVYSFGDKLDVKKLWWENIEIEPRQLHFVSVSPDITLCALICEDLARQDPVAEMVRAVGPNLVVALLSDGPQINGRWPSRYASVLADDPGCSVLTLSNLGMVERSRPHGVPVNRTVASWKDFKGAYVPIDLGVSEDAVVIDVRIDRAEEWTIDGRSDQGGATYPLMVGVHGLGRV